MQNRLNEGDRVREKMSLEDVHNLREEPALLRDIIADKDRELRARDAEIKRLNNMIKHSAWTKEEQPQ